MKIKAIVLSVFAAVAVSCGVSKDYQIEKEFADPEKVLKEQTGY